MEQRSETWHSQRIGMLTASKFPDLMKNGRSKNSIGQTALSYIKQVATEAITGVHSEIYSPHLDWGVENEAEAFNTVNEWMESQELERFHDCQFYSYKGEFKDLHHYIGGTPDGYNSDAVLEIKCPSNQTKHFERILDPQKLVDEYLYQILGEMLITGKKKALAVSFDPRFPDESKLVTRWVYLEEEQEAFERLQNRLLEAVPILKSYFTQYKNVISNEAK